MKYIFDIDNVLNKEILFYTSLVIIICMIIGVVYLGIKEVKK